MRIYLDSCIVIYIVEGPESLQDLVESALTDIYEDEDFVELCVSPLVRLECRVAPIRDGDQSLLADLDEFFASEGVVSLPISEPTFDVATTLRAENRLKTPDALHLAVALDNECDELWTNDDRFARAATGTMQIRCLV